MLWATERNTASRAKVSWRPDRSTGFLMGFQRKRTLLVVHNGGSVGFLCFFITSILATSQILSSKWSLELCSHELKTKKFLFLTPINEYLNFILLESMCDQWLTTSLSCLFPVPVLFYNYAVIYCRLLLTSVTGTFRYWINCRFSTSIRNPNMPKGSYHGLRTKVLWIKWPVSPSWSIIFIWSITKREV